uniref:DUF5641 domain-containing protein n=1 Tax=Parascaris univalens TaxID=6257 RepID=A0A915B4J6_PARUN
MTWEHRLISWNLQFCPCVEMREGGAFVFQCCVDVFPVVVRRRMNRHDAVDQR